MRLKTGLNLTKNYSFNFDLQKRVKKNIKFIIVHYTGMKKETEAIKRLKDPKSKVSSHYFIKNNGEILRLVPDLYIAWHAGRSSWKKLKSLNKYSIGIEISNPGHNHTYKSFSFKQLVSIKKLLNLLIKEYQIKLDNVLGHSDVAPYRKKDPGEKFPWRILAKKRLCRWHNLDNYNIKKFRNIHLSLDEKKIFLKNLYKIGYSKVRGINVNLSTRYIVLAFQRRFRQSLVNGKMDKECFLITKSLLN